MKMKKTLTAAVAMVLVAAVSVAGTLAYLTDKTGPVTNTFTAGKLGEGLKLELWENPVQQNVQGNYEKKDEAKDTDGVEYPNLIPMSDNFKNPTVEVSNLTTEAYLFIKVSNNEAETDAIEATVDTGIWKQIAVNGNEKVYALKAGTINNITNEKYSVLTGNHFTVKDFDANNTQGLTFDEIVVNAYICQAQGFKTAEEAWNATFGAAQA